MSHVGDKTSFRSDLGLATGSGSLASGVKEFTVSFNPTQYNIVATAQSAGISAAELRIENKTSSTFEVTSSSGSDSRLIVWIAIKV